MKRVLTMSLTTVLIALACAGAAFAQGTSQPLGDYARSAKKSKAAPAPAAAKVYDNDNLPTAAPVSVVGHSDASADTNPLRKPERLSAADRNGVRKAPDRQGLRS